MIKVVIYVFFLRFYLVLAYCPVPTGGGKKEKALPHHDAATSMLRCGSIYFWISTFCLFLVFLPLHNYALRCEI